MGLKYNFTTLSELGKRANNEDCLAAYESNNYAFFIVCDGVGGHEKGEVASKTVVESMVAGISKTAAFVNSTYLSDLLFKTEEKLFEYVLKNPDAKNMASTLAIMYLKPNTALIGWIGDSRVYHIRDGKVIYHTKDHSYVNYLVSIGDITEQEAINHPKKNVVMRVVKGDGSHTKMDLIEITDIQPNDYFLIASDGVWGSIDDNDITQWFVRSSTPEKIEKQIRTKCEDVSDDNFSCVVVKIGKETLLKRILNTLKK